MISTTLNLDFILNLKWKLYSCKSFNKIKLKWQVTELLPTYLHQNPWIRAMIQNTCCFRVCWHLSRNLIIGSSSQNGVGNVNSQIEVFETKSTCKSNETKNKLIAISLFVAKKSNIYTVSKTSAFSFLKKTGGRWFKPLNGPCYTCCL